MRVEGLIINYAAGGTVNPYRIVKHGAADQTAIQAAAATDALMGVADQMGAGVAGDPLDVIKSDLAEVEFGGNVTRGDWLTSDSQGRAVTAAPATGATVQVIGRAEVSGVLGDIGSVHVSPCALTDGGT